MKVMGNLNKGMTMWALIRDDDDGELRVIPEDIARDEYLNGRKYFGAWKLQVTNADKELLLTMARLTGGREEKLGHAVKFLED